MLRDYADITSRLGAPKWWDDHGVPRYEPFHPGMLGVYDDVAALLDIACQSCPRRFHVAMSTSLAWLCVRSKDRKISDGVPLPTLEPGFYHYGDPPPHGCVGDTMNCEDLRVLEFWTKRWSAPDADTFKEWVRLPEQEVPLMDHPDFVEPEARS